ncbi:hypothetical protein PV04_02764 [Phialophora macrospora]|uniref:Uncharacterized protein n=1 Tax=Phialophora macrospora TaxID=1851006 RepID=A0A0D2E8A0_9EURO|nr:hypothetical protein PV04_02764 [Phialophora macrospora]
MALLRRGACVPWHVLFRPSSLYLSAHLQSHSSDRDCFRSTLLKSSDTAFCQSFLSMVRVFLVHLVDHGKSENLRSSSTGRSKSTWMIITGTLNSMCATSEADALLFARRATATSCPLQ